MPNWCQNQLMVDEPMSNELTEYLKEHGFSFRKISPCEETVEAQEIAWSTKWDLSDDNQRETADMLIADSATFFDTAWSPPTEAIRKLSELFPDDGFTLRYYEEGVMFCGETVFEDGLDQENVFIQHDKKAFNQFIQEYMGLEPLYDDEDEDYEDDENDEEE
jgi:hypothetical protein